MLRPVPEPSELPPVPEWSRRTITLIADRAEVERICQEWRDEAWQVLAIDEGPPTPAGHVTHTVRVAVPPRGWLSNEELLAQLEHDA